MIYTYGTGFKGGVEPAFTLKWNLCLYFDTKFYRDFTTILLLIRILQIQRGWNGLSTTHHHDRSAAMY